MLNVNELIGFGAGGGRGNTAYGLTDTKENDTSLTTYTFTDVNLGPADDPERYIFVVSTNQATQGNGSGGTWTLSINGNAATEIARRANGSQVLYLHALKVPSGATATIEAVHSLAGRGFAISVYAVYGQVNILPLDIQHVISTTLTDTILVPTGGWVIAGVSTNSGTPANYTGLTTDFSAQVGTANQCVSFGSAFDVTASPLTYTHAFAGSSETMFGASFGWVGADPYWSNVITLLPLSSNFTDVIGYATTTTYGNIAINNGVQLFGQDTALFDGTGDYLNLTTVTIATDESCCFEAWVHKTATDASGYSNVFSTTGVNNQFTYDNGGTGFVNLALNSAVVLAPRDGGIQLNTWHHIAWSRHGQTWRVFVDGVQKGDTATNGTTFAINLIGTYGGGGYEVNGRMSNIRITKGAARYTANFTPPTAPFPTSL